MKKVSRIPPQKALGDAVAQHTRGIWTLMYNPPPQQPHNYRSQKTKPSRLMS